MSFFAEEEYRDQIRKQTNAIGRIVYAVQFNHDASFLAAGTSVGQIALFDLHNAAIDHSSLSFTDDHTSYIPPRIASPWIRFDTTAGSIYDMHSENGLLVCGTEKGVHVCTWNELVEGKININLFQIDSYAHANMPICFANRDIEANALTGMRGGQNLFMATGDGNAYALPLSTLHQGQCFQGAGPRAYMHCIAMCGRNQPHTFLTVRYAF